MGWGWGSVQSALVTPLPSPAAAALSFPEGRGRVARRRKTLRPPGAGALQGCGARGGGPVRPLWRQRTNAVFLY